MKEYIKEKVVNIVNGKLSSDQVEELIGFFRQALFNNLDHDDEREKIAQQGMEFVRANHSNKIRAKQLFQQLREVL